MRMLLDYLMLLPLLVYVDGAKNKIKCYQCMVDKNDLCTEEYLKMCPDNQAYDSCMTRISKTKANGFLIEKRCALGPCTLRDPQQSEGLGLDNCDRSEEEYDCISCCKTDGCNRDGSAIYRPVLEVQLGLVASSLFLIRTLFG